MKTYVDFVYNPQFPDACLLDLYIPEGEGPFPLYLYFHGGGLEAGSRKGKDPVRGLAERGIAVATADYRMYPSAKYPDFIEDAAFAAGWLKTHAREFGRFDRLSIGGSSAGAYLTMMLFFDPHYLQQNGVERTDVSAFVFDAGQPTVHFNILRERGVDTRAIRLDDAAPLFFVDQKFIEPSSLPRILTLFTDQDMPGREEQNRLLLKTMRQFGYPEEKLELEYLHGFPHCGYLGEAGYLDRIAAFLKSGY